jgi:hypothetical protein
MSQLAVNAVTDANGGNTATINSMTPTADSLQGFRNRIINGDMRIDQRNAGASVTLGSTESFVVDRWKAWEATDGAATAQQSTTVPNGFVNSFLWTTTTADASLGATQYGAIGHVIEGFNIADLGWGTANAKTVTLSFWVRSSLTGTFGGALSNIDVDRSYPFTYSISAANTWEQKSVTISGDTSGTWLTDNGSGLRIYFGLGVGSTYSGTAGAWAGSQFLSATGAVSVIGTLNATWYITGVQLEVGSVATPFERRPFGTELALCQRYFEKSYNMSVVPGTATAVGARVGGTYRENGPGAVQISYLVAKRATPTISIWGTDGTSGQVTDNAGRAGTVANNGETGATVTYGGNDNFVGFTQFRAEIEL